MSGVCQCLRTPTDFYIGKDLKVCTVFELELETDRNMEFIQYQSGCVFVCSCSGQLAHVSLSLYQYSSCRRSAGGICSVSPPFHSSSSFLLVLLVATLLDFLPLVCKFHLRCHHHQQQPLGHLVLVFFIHCCHHRFQSRCCFTISQSSHPTWKWGKVRDM